MKEQIRLRVEELKGEFEAGQARLRELETQEARLRETMLRISGAIQVLEEMLVEGSESNEAATPGLSETGQASGTP
jgi:predicted nuclease with TOPRIM domain